MLNFKKITLEDKPVLDNFLISPKEFSCENTFVNLFVWQNAYHNQFAIEDGQLFLKHGSGKNVGFRLPIGNDLEKGLNKIIDYCSGRLPHLWSPVNEDFSRIPHWFYEKYNVTPTRDAFDYIYLQKDLAELSGKKYHSKRNHISAFSKKYDWRYEKITDDNLENVRECAKEWYLQNNDRLDKFALHERDGIETVLNNMAALSVTGGAIFVEDRVAAFTLGTPINQKVFDIFAEKALPEFATAYTVINNCFARELEGYKYINREDDMGLEGLRRAKLSYRPAVILEKYLFTPKQTTDKG